MDAAARLAEEEAERQWKGGMEAPRSMEIEFYRRRGATIRYECELCKEQYTGSRPSECDICTHDEFAASIDR
jgi:hypothetical protein